MKNLLLKTKLGLARAEVYMSSITWPEAPLHIIVYNNLLYINYLAWFGAQWTKDLLPVFSFFPLSTFYHSSLHISSFCPYSFSLGFVWSSRNLPYSTVCLKPPLVCMYVYIYTYIKLANQKIEPDPEIELRTSNLLG